MAASSLRKRLDAIEKRRLVGRAYIFINHHAEQPADGKPYRKTGESTDDCKARYGIKSGICIFFDMTGTCIPLAK